MKACSGAYRCVPRVPLVEPRTHSWTDATVRRVPSHNAPVAVRLQYGAPASSSPRGSSHYWYNLLLARPAGVEPATFRVVAIDRVSAWCRGVRKTPAKYG